MIHIIFWAVVVVTGIKGECILNEESKIDTGACSAKVVCDGMVDKLSETIRNSFKCIRHQNPYYYETKYTYSNNYILNVVVYGIDINISADPIYALLDVKDKVTILNIDKGDLISVPIEVMTLKQLTKLSLTNNNVESINLKKFVTMAHMQMLNVSYNLISSIDIFANVSETLSPMNTIDFSNNLIDSIPDNCFTSFPHLKYLDLSYNKLVSFNILTFEGITQIETLILSNNKLIEIGQNFARFTKLKYLSLDHNSLQTITNIDFRTLKDLEKFYLNFNFIKNIEEDSFSTLGNLYELDLSHNNIKVINKTLFANNKMLKKLLLYDNDIQNIEIGSFKNNNISFFDIHGNSLDMRIEYETFQGIHIQNFDLSRENLKSLGNRAFSAFKSDLIFLNLSSNSIENISKSAFQTLNNLSKLDLSFNKLNEIKFDTNDLKELSEYYLNNNQIKKITEKMFSNLTSLMKLDVSKNAIENIELNSFSGIPNLNILNLSNNYISNSIPVGILNELNKVKHLDLSYTRLVSYPNKTFTGMVSLILLKSSHSQLENLEYEAFKGTGALQIIDLSYNMLQCFYINTSNIPEISELYLNHNKIKNIINVTFKNLSRLEKLDLSSNNIVYIDSSSLVTLVHLNYLNLTSNVNLELHNQIFNNLFISQVLLTNLWKPFNFENAINASVSILSLKYCNIENINSVFIYKLKNILKIDLSSNKLKYLDKGSFQIMEVLNWLDLSFNMISDIQPGTFRLTNLINTLNLCGNNLQYLRYGVLDGLKNLHLLNLSNNAIHTFGANLLHNTPDLSYLSLENNNLADINLVQFSTTNIRMLYVGGNIISCDILTSFNNVDNLYFNVTSEKLDFNTDNVNGISCRTSSLSQNFDNRKNNFTNAISMQNTELHFNNLTASLNKIVSKIGSTMQINAQAYLDKVIETLNQNQNFTNHLLSNIIDENKKLQLSVARVNVSFLTYFQLISKLLEINNNLTKSGYNDTNEIKTEFFKIMSSKVQIPASIEMVTESRIETDRFLLADIKQLLSNITWVLYCIVSVLAITFVIYIAVLIHKSLTLNSKRCLRKTNSHNSGQPIHLGIEMD